MFLFFFVLKSYRGIKKLSLVYFKRLKQLCCNVIDPVLAAPFFLFCRQEKVGLCCFVLLADPSIVKRSRLMGAFSYSWASV
ncbi:hypothetical protein A7K93_04750 [Candidatus Methylacidiphilum fumarolicum]|nr:hypothetical protein A7K93_04750 [Candidatus Methylacidiphilum fumarolicum]TFE75818.1 hypothetical protein A7K72_01430 [Candidatus Methylacidiphilum fumarolicum]TFE75979.1 hypothetical protein A7D33_01635 [Candidatus Methylacidiphilum fumarolicum]